MTFDYQNIAETAFAQINDKGRDVDVVYRTEGSYDVNNDVVLGDSDTTVTVRALITNFNKRDVSAGLVEVGDLQVMIAAQGITKPTTNDKIINGGVTYTVVTVTEIKPGNVAILYKLQVRK